MALASLPLRSVLLVALLGLCSLLFVTRLAACLPAGSSRRGLPTAAAAFVTRTAAVQLPPLPLFLPAQTGMQVGLGRDAWLSPNNTFVENGTLILRAKRQHYKGQNFTSAAVISQNKQYWKYGRFCIRAKLPGAEGDGASDGVWPGGRERVAACVVITVGSECDCAWPLGVTMKRCFFLGSALDDASATLVCIAH